MRKELYKDLITELQKVNDGVIRHIDLWNNNVDFIEQEDGWERPAVFVEFMPLRWKCIARGRDYRDESAQIKLHIVVDWQGSAAADSPLQEESLEVFDLCDAIHKQLMGLSGEKYKRLDLVQSDTNHNHEDIVEYIETYECVAFKGIE